jgi:hypothetical protein
MAELTQAEKDENAWWFSRMDDDYKTIRLIDHGKVVAKYGTANARYTDEQDAEAAFYTANIEHERVSCVAVEEKRYKLIGSKIHRIADLPLEEDAK